MEQWKQIESINYAISNHGSVYSNVSQRFLKPYPNRQGYLVVDLRRGNQRYMISVHRLVALSFIQNPGNKPEVNHDDGNKQNNYYKNLLWATKRENIQHAYDTGLNPNGSGKPNAKLHETDILSIRELMLIGVSNQIIANMYRVSSGTISALRLGHTWKHIFGDALLRSGPNPIKKLQPEDIPVIREMFLKGLRDCDIGAVYNVARGTINQIRQGKTWINY
jgi:hypothetical protein